MRYDTEQMMFVGTAVTAEETAALGLHYEIIAAAQTAAAGLLDMARKIKRMRDTGGYKALGFESLEAYTQATMGMRQRQAYNYISIAEKLPAQLIEQNAAAGVTKLALLASLTAGEQKQITAETDLAGTTVTALKRQIRELQEKNTGYAQQLSLLQANAEDDRQTARRDAQETVRRDLEAAVQRQKEAEAAAKQDRRERDAALAAAEKLKAEAEQHEKALEKARAEGAADAEEKARAEVRMEAEAKLAEEKAAREAAEERAAQLAKQLQVSGDESTVKFGLLFQQLQENAYGIDAICKELTEKGEVEKAGKFRTALGRALTKLAEQLGSA